MPIRPADHDVLEDITQSIAESNSGFVYVDRVHDSIKNEYEAASTGIFKASTLKRSDIREALSNMGADENHTIEEIRTGVYFWDPFRAGVEMDITSKLEGLFRSQMVVTGDMIREALELAREDTEFITNKLSRQELVKPISAGTTEYYIGGEDLEGEANLGEKLKRRGSYGTISHEQLESALSVSATSDVIGYLQADGYIIDLDGSYLVTSALDDYIEKVVRDVADDIETTFESNTYVLPLEEFTTHLKEEVRSRSDVLVQISRSRADLTEHEFLTLLREAFTEEESPLEIEISDSDDVATLEPPLQEMIDAKARELTKPLLNKETASSADTMKQTVEDDVAELQLAPTEAGSAYIRQRIRTRGNELIDEQFEI